MLPRSSRQLSYISQYCMQAQCLQTSASVFDVTSHIFSSSPMHVVFLLKLIYIYMSFFFSFRQLLHSCRFGAIHLYSFFSSLAASIDEVAATAA